ncbi:MAG TPA: Hsp20/alpha crystallin family protein [Gemmatimonadaceae bacterium]
MALVKSWRPLTRQRPIFPSFGPLPTFEELENRMRKMVEGSFLAPAESELFAQPMGFLPATDIVETDDLVVLAIELPGLEKKDLDINVEDGVLSVRGEKLEEKKQEDKKYHLLERTYGSFQRSFMLPRSVDSEKISAEFQQGVLKILLPKTAEAKVKGRKIEIAPK